MHDDTYRARRDFNTDTDAQLGQLGACERCSRLPLLLHKRIHVLLGGARHVGSRDAAHVHRPLQRHNGAVVVTVHNLRVPKTSDVK